VLVVPTEQRRCGSKWTARTPRQALLPRRTRRYPRHERRAPGRRPAASRAATKMRGSGFSAPTSADSTRAETAARSAAVNQRPNRAPTGFRERDRHPIFGTEETDSGTAVCAHR
jgi:hypothetical protein